MIYDIELCLGILWQVDGGKNPCTILTYDIIREKSLSMKHIEYALSTKTRKAVKLCRFFLTSWVNGIDEIDNERNRENIYAERKKICLDIPSMELGRQASIAHLVKYLSIIYVGIVGSFLISIHLARSDDSTISGLSGFHFYEYCLIG